MNDTLVDVIDIGNLILGSVAFALLFSRTWRRRREYPEEVYLLLIILEAFVIALLATSAQLLALGADRWLLFVSVLITAVKLGLFWVLWKTRNTLFRTGHRHVGEGVNSDETNVNKDVIT